MIGAGLTAPMRLRGGHVILFERRGNVLCGRACIYTRFGPLHFTAAADLSTVKRAVKAAMRTELGKYADRVRAEIAAGGDEETLVAGFFDDVGKWFEGAGKTIAKGIGKIAKNDIFRTIAGGFQAVMSNPITGPLLTAIPFVGPALQVTAQGAGFLAQAYAGDPKAKAKLGEIKKRAKAGDPKAKKAFAELQRVQKQGLAAARGVPVPSIARVDPETPTREELVAALQALVAQCQAQQADVEAAGEVRAGRVDPRRYDAMRRAYQASGYRIGATGLPYTLEAGADGAYRLPRSVYGLHSPHGLRIQ